MVSDFLEGMPVAESVMFAVLAVMIAWALHMCVDTIGDHAVRTWKAPPMMHRIASLTTGLVYAVVIVAAMAFVGWNVTMSASPLFRAVLLVAFPLTVIVATISAIATHGSSDKNASVNTDRKKVVLVNDEAKTAHLNGDFHAGELRAMADCLDAMDDAKKHGDD